jgi:unsaturated rhamnogalacturonyl hydrolase
MGLPAGCGTRSADATSGATIGGATSVGGTGTATIGGTSPAVGGATTAGGTSPAAVGGKSSGGSSNVGGPGGSMNSGGVAAAGRGGATPNAGTSGANSTVTWAVRFADTVIKRWPDPHNITGITRPWDYNNGIVLRGMQEVFAKTGDARYRAYIKQYVDSFVDASGNLYTDSTHTVLLKNQTFSLDLIQPAILLLFLNEQYPTDARYQTAAATVRNMYASFPTNADGGFWHKQTYPNEMWLDGIYMAEPFLTKFGAANPSCGAYCNDTPVAQATLLATHVQLASGLLLHGWDYDHNATWCLGTCAGTSGTGLSPEVWSRATGWYSAALVDILQYLPATHAGRADLIALLQGIAAAAKQNQDLATGLWCQVVDKCSLTDNWPESSGTGLLVYAIKTGVDRGYLDASHLAVAQKAWNGLVANEFGSDAAGPIINGAADGMSIQSSYAAYVAIPKKSNSYHGLCAVQLAAAAMEY